MSYLSFEGTDAERTLAPWRGGWRMFAARWRGRRFRDRRLVFAILVCGHVLQERRGGHKKQASSDGAAEVEQSIIVAGWPADKHVFKHRLNGAGGTAVSDKISSKLTKGDASERHVVAQYLDFFPVLDNCGQSIVGRAWLDRIVQFDVRQFLAADDFFLFFCRQRVPSVKIVKIFLHDDVAAAGEGRIFLSNKHGSACLFAPRILCSVDKTDQIAVVEVTETMHLILWRGCGRDPRHDLCRKLETQIHPFCTNVKK